MPNPQDESHSVSSANDEGSLSLSTLFQAALAAVTRALNNDDPAVSLKAAKIALDQFRRLNLTPEDYEQVITITYGEAPSNPNPKYTSPRPGAGPGITRPVQGRGVRQTLGQDRGWQDRGH